MIQYFSIIIKVKFNMPRPMPPLLYSGREWSSAGYYQIFLCSEQSEKRARELIRRHLSTHEENFATCQWSFIEVKQISVLNSMNDLPLDHYKDLTEAMFAARNEAAIWFYGIKDHYSTEETASPMEDWDEEDEWGDIDGQCQACDAYGPIDDTSLCEECSPKFERDMIRERAWNFSAIAYATPVYLREKLREDMIRQFGAKNELIAPSDGKKHKRRSK